MSFTRKAAVVLAGGVLALAGSAAPTFGASPSQEECEAQEGTFDRQNGQVSCTVTEEGKNPKFTEDTETTGQGNIGNKTEETQDCDPTGSNKCPPGQFPE